MIITICGSYRFREQMMKSYTNLSSKGIIVLLPAFDCNDKMSLEDLHSLHESKILMSNYIFVVDTDGSELHIGDDTFREIKFALANSIEVKYLSDNLIGI